MLVDTKSKISGSVPEQVKLSFEAKVPEGQFSIHDPFDKKYPGKQPVHTR